MGRVSSKPEVVWSQTITLTALCTIVRSGGPLIYYDRLDGVLRAMEKIAGAPLRSALRLLGSSFGFRLARLPNGDTLPDYPKLHVESHEQVSGILVEHMQSISASDTTPVLSALLGEQCARSYYIKVFAEEHLLRFVLGINVIRAAHPGESLVVIVPDSWGASTQELVLRSVHVGKTGTYLRLRPSWISRVVSMVRLLGASSSVFVKLLRRSFRTRPHSRRSYKLASEFIDTTRFSGKPGEPDFLVDGQAISDEDVLYYVTPRQYEKLLRDAGGGRASIGRLMQERGRSVVFLDELPVSLRSWSLFLRSLPRVLQGIWRRDTGWFGGSITARGIEEYIEYCGLFEHFRVESHVFLTMPNGHTSQRANSGVVTGACRRFGVLSFSYQTRLFYMRHYMYGFECLDLTCLWGQGFLDVIQPYAELLGQVVFVGDVYLDPLLAGEALYDSAISKDERPLVVVFPGNIGPEDHYTYAYTMAFLGACCEAALALPSLSFVVKPKDPADAQLFRESAELGPKLVELGDRFSMSVAARFDTDSLIKQAAAVVSIGFTTPGVDALLAGKPSIYFDGIGAGGDIFRESEGLVVRTTEELVHRLTAVISDGAAPSKKAVEALNSLDPFRDGMARSRIVAAMSHRRGTRSL